MTVKQTWRSVLESSVAGLDSLQRWEFCGYVAYILVASIERASGEEKIQLRETVRKCVLARQGKLAPVEYLSELVVAHGEREGFLAALYGIMPTEDGLEVGRAVEAFLYDTQADDVVMAIVDGAVGANVAAMPDDIVAREYREYIHTALDIANGEISGMCDMVDDLIDDIDNEEGFMEWTPWATMEPVKV